MSIYRTAVLALSTLAAASKTSSAFSPVAVQRTVFAAAHRQARSLSTIPRAMSSTTAASSATDPPPVIRGRPTWQQTMIRIADPAKSLSFYTGVLGMTHIDTLDFPQWNFSIYFATTLPEGETYALKPGTQAAHDYLWSMEGVALELTHNHGTEDPDGDFEGYYPGNGDRDGFGHLAVSCDDVYAACEELEKKGVQFKKKPDEGRMKGLAFAYDPDQYWVEVVRRRTAGKSSNKFNFSQTMLRVKDPKKSVDFYKRLGMKVMAEKHFPDAKFSLYFLASNVADADVPDDPTTEEAVLAAGNLFQPVLELTHNHGTEDDADFKHYNGNEEGRQGFGHIGFLVDDVYQACDDIRELGYGFKKEPDGGTMKGLAFAWDPDGYPVEIIKRGGMDFQQKNVE